MLDAADATTAVDYSVKELCYSGAVPAPWPRYYYHEISTTIFSVHHVWFIHHFILQ